jgi:hypothetical protein
MNFVKLLFIGAFALTRADELVKKPAPVLKFKVNLNFLETMFHLRDQEVFEALKEVPIQHDDAAFTDVQVTVSPQGNVEKFDFDLNLKSDDFGAESS